MKAIEIMNELFAFAEDVDFSKSCDTCKAGNPETEVKKVAVTMIATVDIIQKAKQWGAQLLITHEPIYYSHYDIEVEEKIQSEKRKRVEESGMTVYRYHDHPHRTIPDMVSMGEFECLGLEGTLEESKLMAPVRLHLKHAITPVQLAKIIEKKFNIKHVRLCGARDIPCRVISGMFGQPDSKRVLEELQNAQSEIIVLGEVCEWMVGEYVRDAAALGYKKAMLVLGHIGSERESMRYTANLLKSMHPELEVKYFESDEVYTYTDENDV